MSDRQLTDRRGRRVPAHSQVRRRGQRIQDCWRCLECIMASRALFGNDDALCSLDSSGPGMWAKLAGLIEGKN